MEIIAHRGASSDAPENTLAAVRLAWVQQADAVEVDVHLSADQRVVVMHDANTRRTGGANRRLAHWTLEQLRALDVGRWRGPLWAGERIPALDQVVATVPAGKRLFIEIKCGPEIIASLAPLLAQSGKELRQFVLIGFSFPTMLAVRRALPSCPVLWLGSVRRSLLPRRFRNPDALVRVACDAGFNGLDLHANRWLNAPVVERVRAAGLGLYAWTVDRLPIARRLAALGLDGITTNRPGWMRQHLR